MSDERRQPELGHADPVRTTHELVNVLAAVQIHVFMARRTFAAPGAGDDAPSTADSGAAAPATPADLLLRLEGMVDRALELANQLDEQLRILGPG